jgi:hypothetical protein
MINMNEVGAFPSRDPSGNFTVRIGLYLPGIHATDGFSVVVRVVSQANIGADCLRAGRRTFRLPQTDQRVPALVQESPQALVDVRVVGKELFEVARLV